VKEYTVSVGRATRESPLLRLGASPRSMLQLLRAAKATAALDARDFVLPDDVIQVAEAVLAHRIILDRKAAGAGETAHTVLQGILSRLPVPQAPAGAGNAAGAGTAAGTRNQAARNAASVAGSGRNR